MHYHGRLTATVANAQVTLAEAVPVQGSGLTLPLDLFHIAARCNGAYFASKRFAAVQLAYTHPRCRVLVFHTGRLVGTGALTAQAFFCTSLHALSSLVAHRSMPLASFLDPLGYNTRQ